MKDLRYISYLEEINGINEAIYLLEERINEGARDKETVLRLLFLYWFMETEPAYLTNDQGSRDWQACFKQLMERFSFFDNDAEYNGVVGYLLWRCPGWRGAAEKGQFMLAKAFDLVPKDTLVRAIWQLSQGQKPEVDASVDSRLAEMGVMGEYLRQVFSER